MTKAQQRREELKNVYQGIKWREKVDRMTDGQVSAIWFRLKQQNKL